MTNSAQIAALVQTIGENRQRAASMETADAHMGSMTTNIKARTLRAEADGIEKALRTLGHIK